MSGTYLGADGAVTVESRRGSDGRERVTVGETEFIADVQRFADGEMAVTLSDGRVFRAVVTYERDCAWVSVGGRTFRLQEVEEGASVEEDMGSLEAPMPGTVLKVNVSVGDQVEAGQTLLVLEAMKMEHEIKAPYDGTVSEIAAVEGAMVNPGKKLVSVDE